MTMTREVEVWRSPEEAARQMQALIDGWRKTDREDRRRDRRVMQALVAFFGLMVVVLCVLIASDNGAESAAAGGTLPPASTVPYSPEFARPVPELVPEQVTTTTAPLPLTIHVAVPGWVGDGEILTDGRHAPRVMPGEPCRTVIAIPFDPSSAGTVIVGGDEWRVRYRNKVSASGLERITEVCPDVPTVYVVSALPGNPRPYVEATR